MEENVLTRLRGGRIAGFVGGLTGDCEECGLKLL